MALKSSQLYSKDWFGTLMFAVLPSTVRHYNQSLILDVNQSETKAIKTFLSFCKLLVLKKVHHFFD